MLLVLVRGAASQEAALTYRGESTIDLSRFERQGLALSIAADPHRDARL